MNNDVSGAIIAIAVLIFALILMSGLVVKELDEIRTVAGIGEAYLEGNMDAKEAIDALAKIDDGTGCKELIIAFILEDVPVDEAKEILKVVLEN
jgi:hypothetical protein